MANEFKVKNGLIVSGSADIEQNLTVRGTLTVEELHTSITTSSILYRSGSTGFGNSLDDVHSITGSVNVTGSISVNGQPLGTGKLDETTFNTYTSSTNVRLDGIEVTTGSLNSYTTSTNVRLEAIEISTASLNTFSSSTSGRISTIETTTGSLNSYTTSANLRLDAIETSSASLNSFTSSSDTRLTSIETSTGSLNNYTTSNNVRLYTIETTTASLNTFSSSTNTRLDSIETATGSLNSFTNSINTTIKNKLNSDSVISGSIQINLTGTTGYSTFSSSIATIDANQDSRLNAIETSTASLNSFTNSINTTIKNKLNSDGVISGSAQVDITNTTNYSTFSSSIATTDANQNAKLTSLESASSSIRTDFNTYTSSNNVRITAVETSTGSLNSFTSSINTTIKNKLNSDGVISGSVQIDITQTTGYSTFSGSLSSSVGSLSGSLNTAINNLSSSIATTDAGQNTRLNSLEGKTGSYATTGSNRFVGDQIVTGSLTVTQNLTILGSSSLMIVTSSQLAVSSSTISVNVFEPSERFGGLKVFDSGSSNATASLLWDSLLNRWIYQNASGSGYSGGMLMMGPRNTGSLGDEVGTIANVVMKGQGGDHITGSNITDDGTNVRINSNTIVTGSLIVTSTISSTNITAIETATGSLNSYTSSNTSNISAIHTATSSLNTFTSSASGRLSAIETSTGSLNSFTNSINTTIKNKLNIDGVLSGSYLGTATTTNLTEGTNLYYTDARVKTKMNTDVVMSGSYLGTASTSNLSEGTNLYYTDARVKTKISADNVHSGSFLGTASTSNLSEGTNLYYTDGRARGALSFSAGSGAYNSSTGVITIPTNTNQLTNGAGYITSSADISGYSARLFSADIRTISPSSHSAGRITAGFTSWNNNNTPDYADYIHLRGYTDSSGGPDNLVMFKKNGIGMRIWQQTYGSSTAYSSYVDVLHSSNYNSYSPTLTGGGASGTWGIRITGFANAGSPRLYSTDGSYNYDAANPYYGYLTYDGSRWLFQVSPATPSAVRVAYADSAGSASSATTASNSNALNGLSVSQIFNNMGEAHGARTSFDSGSPSYDFGFRYIQGSTNGPGTSGSQFYSWYIGLGNQYPSTGGGSYGAMFAVDRNVTNPYLSVRYNESNSFTSWRKIYAGYADSAGNADTVDGYHASGLWKLNEWNGNLYAHTDGRVYATIFYDANDSGYYLDPNSTSRIRKTNLVASGSSWDDGLNLYSSDGSNRWNLLVDDGAGDHFRIAYNNAERLQLQTGGSAIFAGLITENSSIRYKKDIQTITNGLDMVLNMRGVSYIKKDNETKEIGLIAEEIAEILPDVVIYDEEGRPDAISYGRITAVLIEAIKDLKKEINELKNNG